MRSSVLLIVSPTVWLEIFLDPFDELSPLEAGLPIDTVYGEEGSVEVATVSL